MCGMENQKQQILRRQEFCAKCESVLRHLNVHSDISGCPNKKKYNSSGQTMNIIWGVSINEDPQ